MSRSLSTRVQAALSYLLGAALPPGIEAARTERSELVQHIVELVEQVAMVEDAALLAMTSSTAEKANLELEHATKDFHDKAETFAAYMIDDSRHSEGGLAQKLGDAYKRLLEVRKGA